MEIPGALLAELTALSAESTDPAFDLPGLVQALQDALLAAVPSGLGLSITIRVGLPAVTVTTLEGTATVESSLRVPLPSPLSESGSTVVVFYAGIPGALVDLAADLQWALHLPAEAMLLDQNLTPASGANPIAGLSEMSVVHRALGALLAQGRTPEAAAAVLRTSADRFGTSVLTVADDLIRALDDRSTPTAAIAAVEWDLDLAALQIGIPWDGCARPGDHICALYRGPAERNELMVPYLQAGLRAGDKCLCLINPPDRTALMDRMSTGINIADYLDSEQLDILQPTDVYLPAGEFSAQQMIGFVTDTMSVVDPTGRYRRFRSAGDMSWLRHRPPGIDQYFGYESDLNRLPQHPTLMCMYDLDDIDQAMLDNLLKTHPTVLHNRETMPSPHYLTPDEYSATHG
jgi:hypothetical protein